MKLTGESPDNEFSRPPRLSPHHAFHPLREDGVAPEDACEDAKEEDKEDADDRFPFLHFIHPSERQ